MARRKDTDLNDASGTFFLLVRRPTLKDVLRFACMSNSSSDKSSNNDADMFGTFLMLLFAAKKLLLLLLELLLLLRLERPQLANKKDRCRRMGDTDPSGPQQRLPLIDRYCICDRESLGCRVPP
jgi:hypothetical protein